MSRLIPVKYLIDKSREEQSAIFVEARGERDGSLTWAVCIHGMCLSKKGRWRWDRSPSNRSAAFIKGTRFETPEEALAVFERYEKAWKEQNK